MNSTKTFEWGEYSSNAIDYICNSTAWMNIAVGSVRSGKTITAITRYLEFMITSPHTDFMVIGKTLGAVRRNVVKPLMAMMRSMGINPVHNRKDNEVYFMDNVLALYGMGKKDDEEKIQGSTFAGAFIDEGTVITEEAFKMIISRLSDSGAKMFVTCNPSNPNHFLYVEYLMNQELIKEDKLRKWTFRLEENKNLSKEYVENLKASYPEDSVFYKRYILGQWVSGQGAIYDKFNKDNIFSGSVDLDQYDYLEIGSDYGTSTTTCYTLIGIKEYEDHNEYDVICEKGFDAKQEGVTQTDAERVEDIYQLQEEYGLDSTSVFYVSHDAASLLSALQKDKRIKMTLDTFTPDTLECIREISSLFYKNYLHVHSSCTETIKQVESYEWDMKAAQKGIDKPVKKDDHYPDALRAPIMNHLFEDAFYSDLVYL